MEYGRTVDAALITKIVTHPKIWKWMAEDGVRPEDFVPVLDERVWYVLAKDGRKLIGLFVFEPKTSVTYAVHLAVAPAAWGRSVEAFEGVIAWAWEHIGCERLIGEIPVDNAHAARLAKKAGFLHYGNNRQSYRRGGRLIDLRLVGLSREVAMREAPILAESRETCQLAQ